MIGDNMRKPPIGVSPRRIWIDERIGIILNALIRYHNDGLTPMQEWTSELLWLYNERDNKNFDIPNPFYQEAPEKS